MRITDSMVQTQLLAALNTLQNNLAQTQNQISTGLAFTTPSQNPVAAGEVNTYNLALSQTQQYGQNANAAQNQLGLEDNALTQVQNTLQSIRDLALQANNSNVSTQNRAAIAAQVQQLRDSLLSIANSQDGNGNYLFSGYSNQTQPFSLTPTGATYAGDQGQQQVAVGAGLSVATGDNGSVLFEQIKTGNGVFDATAGAANTGSGLLGALTVVNPAAYNGGIYSINFTSPAAYQVVDASNTVVASGTYTSGQAIAFDGLQVSISGAPATGDTFSVTPSVNQDIFTTLQSLITTLQSASSGSVSNVALGNGIGAAINNIDQALQKASDVQTSVGSRLNAITAQSSLNSNQTLNLQSTISQLQNLNYASAITALTSQQTSLQAAMQSYTLIQGLSLFKYL